MHYFGVGGVRSLAYSSEERWFYSTHGITPHHGYVRAML